ncbi:MAG TPA: penicillin-binding protein 2, partial [Bacillales bacterium]
DENAAYELLLSKITEQDLSSIGKQEMQVVSIWRKLNQAMNLTPFIVKSGIKKEVFHRVGAHLDSLPGINLTVDSTRVYPKGHEFYLGSVGSIPRGKLDYYLVRGYNRNDEVGTSYLEQYYEDVLNGIPARMKYVKGNSENPLAEPERIEGRRGYDMVLTINIELQHKVEQILRDILREGMSLPGNPYLNSAYAVVANPNTGGILALAGTEYENGEFHDDSLKTVRGAFAIGSNIKGATVLAGYETDTIPGSINDKPIEFRRGNDFTSYPGNHIGWVDAVEALENSSNVYMGFIAANLADFTITNKGSHYLAKGLPLPGSPKLVSAFKSLRHIYSQFGLGVQTQIDLPREGLGFEGNIYNVQPGQIMRFAIGQFDTYTPIMLAQYMSTIANGGYRMQLHLLKSIREPAVKDGVEGKIVYQYEPNVLNHITMSEQALNVVHRGFWKVTHGSSIPTAPELGEPPYQKYRIAGKTGTADVNKPNGDSTVNELFTGYAPADDPEVVVSVIFPGDDTEGPDGMGHHVKAAGQIFQAYFQLKNGQAAKNQAE